MNCGYCVCVGVVFMRYEHSLDSKPLSLSARAGMEVSMNVVDLPLNLAPCEVHCFLDG